MQPWVLELNGVPSTGTDSPLDIRIKSSMMNDLMSLLDLSCGDPDRALTEVRSCRGPRVESFRVRGQFPKHYNS